MLKSANHILHAQKADLSGVSLQPAEIRADTPRMAVWRAPIGYSRWSTAAGRSPSFFSWIGAGQSSLTEYGHRSVPTIEAGGLHHRVSRFRQLRRREPPGRIFSANRGAISAQKSCSSQTSGCCRDVQKSYSVSVPPKIWMCLSAQSAGGRPIPNRYLDPFDQPHDAPSHFFRTRLR